MPFGQGPTDSMAINLCPSINACGKLWQRLARCWVFCNETKESATEFVFRRLTLLLTAGQGE